MTNPISSIFRLLTYIQSWSELGSNFAVSVESVCEFFGMKLDDQLLKIADDEYLIEGVYTTSPAYGTLPRLALEQFTTWILNIKPDEVDASKKVDFIVFRKEYMIAMSEGLIKPFSTNV